MLKDRDDFEISETNEPVSFGFVALLLVSGGETEKASNTMAGRWEMDSPLTGNVIPVSQVEHGADVLDVH